MFLVYAHITRAFTGKHTNAKIYYFHILALTKLYKTQEGTDPNVLKWQLFCDIIQQ